MTNSSASSKALAIRAVVDEVPTRRTRAVTATNLLYNLIAIPGALARFHRQGLHH